MELVRVVSVINCMMQTFQIEKDGRGQKLVFS